MMLRTTRDARARLIAAGVSGPAATAQSQRYEATWNSIDSRPRPPGGATRSSASSFTGACIRCRRSRRRVNTPSGTGSGSAGRAIPTRLRSDAKIRRETRAFHERVYGKDFQYPGLRAAVPRRDVRRRSMGGHLSALRREVRGAGVQASRRIRALAFARSERELGPPVECRRCRPEARSGRRAHDRGAPQEPRDGVLFLAVRVVQPAVAGG